MKRVHLLQVEGDLVVLATLVEAAREQGIRIGWLEFGEVEPPAGLAAALGIGVARAVAAGPHRTVSAKHRRGVAVFEDLIREHFLGCAAVLVKAAADLPILRSDDRGWTVVREGGRGRSFTTDQLIAALKTSRPLTD